MEEELLMGSEIGYPLSDIPRRYGPVPYLLKDYEIHSVEDVRKCLKRKKRYDKLLAEEHLVFLESLAKKITMIMSVEEKEQLTNYELKGQLDDICGLCMKLNEIITRL